MNIELIPLVLLMLGAFCLGLMTMYIYFLWKYNPFFGYLDVVYYNKLNK